MTEKQAEEQGLQFTGCYERYATDALKERAKEIRKQGHRAVIATTTCKGKSIYASKSYFIAEQKERFKNCLQHVESRKQKAKEAYEAELANILAEEEYWKEYIKSN